MNLNNHLQQIYTSLPLNSALLIFTGHDDPRQMAELNRRRNKFETEYRASQSQYSFAATASVFSSGFGAVGQFQQAIVSGNGIEGNKVRDPETGEEICWTAVDARKLEEETEKAKRGLMFLCIKK